MGGAWRLRIIFAVVNPHTSVRLTEDSSTRAAKKRPRLVQLQSQFLLLSSDFFVQFCSLVLGLHRSTTNVGRNSAARADFKAAMLEVKRMALPRHWLHSDRKAAPSPQRTSTAARCVFTACEVY